MSPQGGVIGVDNAPTLTVASGVWRLSEALEAIRVNEWPRNELWCRARAVPSLDQRFADDKSLVDAISGQQLITFTRASAGTYVGSDGVLRTATTNEPRFDHNPTTGESLGLLVEEQRTNSIRNNTMQGAVAGTPGTVPTNWSVTGTANGLTRTISTGTENGISYIDVRYAGTTTAAHFCIIRPEGLTQIAATSGQTWTSSLYMRIAAGSTANITAFENWVIGANSGGFIVESSLVTPVITGTMTRFAVSRTMNNANTALVYPYIAFTFGNGVAIDITLRIGLPQLEQGAFATSVIPTTGAAATRSADVVSISGSNFSSWYRQDEGTFLVSHDKRGALLVANNNSFAERSPQMGVGIPSFAHDFYVITGGLIQANNLGTAHVLGTTSRAAYGIRANDFTAAINGALTATVPSGSVSTMVSQLDIGSLHDGGAKQAGHIRSLTYWPQRLGNEVLQLITQ